jgi:hypothetical protein
MTLEFSSFENSQLPNFFKKNSKTHIPLFLPQKKEPQSKPTKISIKHQEGKNCHKNRQKTRRFFFPKPPSFDKNRRISTGF